MKIKILILLAAAALLVTGFVSSQADEHPGKQVFMDSKCTTCHTVESQDITMKTQKKNVVDLSDVGTVYRANFLEKFLKKEDKINDKTHSIAFKGTDEQLEQLVEWLSTLKMENKQEAGESGEKSGNEETTDTLGTGGK